jgi:hypothetical protein
VVAAARRRRRRVSRWRGSCRGRHASETARVSRSAASSARFAGSSVLLVFGAGPSYFISHAALLGLRSTRTPEGNLSMGGPRTNLWLDG